MRYILIIQLAMLSFAMGACQSKQKQMEQEKMKETFPWDPGIGCAHLYPMAGYRLEYIFSDGSSVGPAFSDFPNGLWGKEDGGSVVGDELKPIPVRLDVTWLSYTENKFWKGSFDLPYDTMLQLFKKGYDEVMWGLEEKANIVYHDNYNTIIAGLAPGGVVVVWLQGGWGHQVEVGRFKAYETTVDMNAFASSAFTDDRTTYVKGMLESEKEVLDNLAKKGLQLGLWDRYREKFNWRPILEADPPYGGRPCLLHKAIISFYNGEQEVLDSAQVTSGVYLPRPRVKEITIQWKSGDGVEYGSSITMDEDEVFAAYKEMYGKDNADQQASLVIEASRYNDQLHAFLRAKNHEVELKKAVVETSVSSK